MCARWQEAQVLAVKPALPPAEVQVRRLRVSDALTDWARKVKAKRLRNAVAGTLPRRLDGLLRELRGSLPWGAWREEWLQCAVEELGHEGAMIRSLGMSMGPPADMPDWQEAAVEQQRGMKEWAAVGSVGGLEVVDGVL